MVPKRILFADDYESIRFVMFENLTRMFPDAEILQAKDGMEAWRLLELNPPDLVITDNDMPAMTGLELLEKIKEKYPDTIVVVISGMGDIELEIRAKKIGASYFFMKPFKMAELEDAILRS